MNKFITEPYEESELRKFCIEMALRTYIHDDGMAKQASVIETAQAIYDWIDKDQTK
jgi:hypothetical protein